MSERFDWVKVADVYCAAIKRSGSRGHLAVTLAKLEGKFVKIHSLKEHLTFIFHIRENIRADSCKKKNNNN